MCDNFMQWFFERVSTAPPPAYFGYRDNRQNPEDFRILQEKGILMRSHSLEEITCDLCDEDHFTPVRLREGGLFIICERGCGTREIYQEEPMVYQYSPSGLLSLFQAAIGSGKTPEEIMVGILWDLGVVNIGNNTCHLFFAPIFDKFGQKITEFISRFSNAVLLTSTSKDFSEQIVCVPFFDLIQSITSQGMSLDDEVVNHYFPTNYELADGETLELDKEMALRDKRLLFGRTRAGTFRSGTDLRPLAARIIKRLFQIRKYGESSMSLGDLAEALGSTPVSVSNEINRISTVCSKYSLPPLLLKYQEKWGINSRLTSCK